jgi:hypothetical protein
MNSSDSQINDGGRGTRFARVSLCLLAACALLIGVVACESRPLWADQDVPPQKWWEERGPVVPHDQFPRECDTCHIGTGWETIKDDFEFDHFAETGTPLNGAHARAECLRCHNDRGPVEVYASRGCKGCHEDPHRRLNGVDCQSCHTEDTWSVKGDIGLHNRTRFPLVGAHAAVACFRCHDGAEVGNFSYADTECISCHEADLKEATNPDHIAQGWVTDCDDCHIPTMWSGGDFIHDFFPLTAAHAAPSCDDCHTNGNFLNTSRDCASCHMEAFQQTSSPDHTEAGFPQQCDLCHTPTTFEGAGFDHAFFPLTGSHAVVDCEECHVNDTFAGTASNCAACHIDDYNDTSDPSHAESGFSTSCETCHTPSDWNNADFNHQFFPLTGSHMGVECDTCHVGGVFEGTSSDCVSCHLQAYEQTSDPNHTLAGFPTDCEACHTPTTWENGNFDHSWWPLTGAHQISDCQSCHDDGVFQGKPNDCASCHISDYNQTNDPNHQAAGFPTSCEVCHVPVSWDTSTFDHSHFPLTGAHLTPDCTDCHIGGNYDATPNTCDGCHLDDYQQTNDPNHQQAGFPTDCNVCHTPTAWQNANFDHSFFPLTGSHMGVDCAQCHTGGVFEGTSPDCVSCHLDDYNGANDPNHAQAGFPTDCDSCHTPTSWQGGNFDHSWFPLQGAHSTPSCEECHVGGVFEGTSSDCASCHLDDYNQTSDPNHQQAGFPTDCAACHQPIRWEDADFDHSQFPLTGGHNGVDCESCHIGGVFEGTSSDCASCHLDDYQQTNNPDHQQAGFPTDCTSCHNTNGWQGATVNHEWWPLTGQHQGVNCEDCHIGGNFQNTPNDCFSCHQGDYNQTNDPNHQDAGFPTDCQQCHSPSGWGGANFDHGFWPLTGQHNNAQCQECHQNGQFEGTSTACYSCHQSDYNNANNPDHQAAGFSTQCQQCHNTNNWGDGNFNHDFPLQGDHNVSCDECHKNTSNFNQFTCIECHAHSKNKMDNEHDDVNNYSWNSNACYNCHPDGDD